MADVLKKEGRIMLQGFGEKVERRMSERLADDWLTEIGRDKVPGKVQDQVSRRHGSPGPENTPTRSTP
jgi:hypothetical protein